MRPDAEGSDAMRPDTRLAMREFRFLDEKRKLTRLKEPEERRWLELKQALSTAGLQQPAPAGNYPAGVNGYPAPPPDQGPPQSAAELLGLVDAEAVGEEVIELDPGDVTMLEAEPPAAPDEAETGSEAPSEAEAPAILLLQSDALDDEPLASRPRRAPSPAEVALQKLTRSTDPFGLLPISVANTNPAPPVVALEVDSQVENLSPQSPLEMPLEIRTDQATVVRVSPDREADELVGAAPLEPDPAQSAATWHSQVPGEHRVIIHLLDGQVKRGIVRDLDLTGSSVHLQEPELSEDIPFDQLKAVFFMGTSNGGHHPEAQKIRVTLTDGRQLTGYSTDYKQSGTGFFLEPSDTRTNTSRIFLLHAGVERIGEE